MNVRQPKAARIVALDGTPQYVMWAEEYLVGASMLARAQDVPVDATAREDFHDETLGAIWDAICDVVRGGSDAILPLVARHLDHWGEIDRVGAEERLAVLASSELAMAYSGMAAMVAHAALVHDWGQRRRRIEALQEEAREVYAGHLVPAAHRFRGGVSLDFEETPC